MHYSLRKKFKPFLLLVIDKLKSGLMNLPVYPNFVDRYRSHSFKRHLVEGMWTMVVFFFLV